MREYGKEVWSPDRAETLLGRLYGAYVGPCVKVTPYFAVNGVLPPVEPIDWRTYLDDE